MANRLFTAGRISLIFVLGLVLLRPDNHGASGLEGSQFDSGKGTAAALARVDLTQVAMQQNLMGLEHQLDPRGQFDGHHVQDHRATTQRSLETAENLVEFWRQRFGGGPLAGIQAAPTLSPSLEPSFMPTEVVKGTGTEDNHTPLIFPSTAPSVVASSAPTVAASVAPTATLVSSSTPTSAASAMPSTTKSAVPTVGGTSTPTMTASAEPTGVGSSLSTVAATPAPSLSGSSTPTSVTSGSPSSVPTLSPTIMDSSAPSADISSAPSVGPTRVPTSAPTIAESAAPSMPPTGIEVRPGDGTSCWRSTTEASLTDLILFLTEPSFDVTVPRVYTFCPGSTLEIGYLVPVTGGFVPFSIEGGSLPFIVLNPNVHLRCGISGESSNNCVFQGGQEQITSESDKVLLSSLLPFLPFLVPGLPAVPPLPDDYHPDSSNLLVQGFTFEGSSDYEMDGEDHAPVSFPGPGTGMVFKDCIFRNNNLSGGGTALSQSAIALKRVPSAHRASGPYNSLTVLDSVFEGNTITDGLIVTTFNGTASENSDPSLIGVTVKRCTFSNNVVQGPSSTLAVIKTDLHTTLTVDKSCFTGNTIVDSGSPTAIVSSRDGVALVTDSYANGNIIPADCSGFAQYTLNGDLDVIAGISCSHFDASFCEA